LLPNTVALPLYTAGAAVKKRQRAAAVQDAGAQFDGPSIFGDYGSFETALKKQEMA
jgi:hypothetical protein